MDLPPYSLVVEPLNLGPDVRAIGLELSDTVRREPLRGQEAARIWSALLPAAAGKEPWALDFFSHLGRVRDFCRAHEIGFRGAAARCLVVPQPEPPRLAELLARFETQTFGARAGAALAAGDAPLEGDLSKRGVDAYHPAYPRYTFCAVCDFENGFLTVLSNALWASEVIRRIRPVVVPLQVFVTLPQ